PHGTIRARRRRPPLDDRSPRSYFLANPSSITVSARSGMSRQGNVMRIPARQLRREGRPFLPKLERLEDRVTPGETLSSLLLFGGFDLLGGQASRQVTLISPDVPAQAPAADRPSDLTVEDAPPVSAMDHDREDASTRYHPVGEPLSSPASSSLTPAQVRHVYGFDQVSNLGEGQTIAIVDAYDDPNVFADADTFSKQFATTP